GDQILPDAGETHHAVGLGVILGKLLTDQCLDGGQRIVERAIVGRLAALQLRYLHLLLLDLGRSLAAVIAVPGPVAAELVCSPTDMGLDLVLGDAGIPTQAPGVRYIRAVIDRELRPIRRIDA